MKRWLALLALVPAAAAAVLLLRGDDEPARDEAIRFVPADVAGYIHLDTDRGASDWKRAAEALDRLPALDTLLLQVAGRQHIVLPPWVGDEAAIALPAERGAEPLFIFDVGDDEKEARAFAAASGGVIENGFVIAGPPELVARARATARGKERSLGDVPEYERLGEDLPDDPLAELYLGPAAMRALPRGMRGFDRSTRAVAATLTVREDRAELRLRARHDSPPGPCSRGSGGAELVDIADPGTAVYLEVPSIGCVIRTLAANLPGAGQALGRFARVARRSGQVSLESELLPLLDRRGALIATPGGAAPVLTLVVEDVDEERALDVFARLQPALIDLLGADELGQVPSFGATEVEGIPAATAQLAPGLELTYAAWDDRLVVSTALEGVAAVKRAEGLTGSDRFESVLGDRPASASALLFLDLDQLLALGEQAGLAEDPRYLAVRDDLQKLRAAGAGISREKEFTTVELTFLIP